MAEEKQIIDVAIIGSGVGGMTAALYAARAGLNAVVFESMGAGGQLANIQTIDNYPGFPEGVGGFDLAWACKQQAERFGARTINERVVKADLAAQPKVLTTDTGEYEARTVIIATGARNRKMGLKGEDVLHGRGISYCATCDGGFFRGKDVVVYGGGNTAVEDALYLSRLCNRVTVVYRKPQLEATAVLVDSLKATENVDFKFRTRITELHEAEGKLGSITLKDLASGETQTMDAAAVFVAIGNIPNSDLFSGQIELEGEYIVAGEDCETNIPGVYAVGDVRTKKLRQVVTAAADGAIAAEAAAALIATK
ncbi:MAG: FAD-dependent oxidoreductase [Coriobacteriia bacterium]|nr:FAD-dependent oxidoreductase [Coriobacteriia bacterium]